MSDVLNNAQWEYDNQEELKKCYETLENHWDTYPVRKINCESCGRVFYTRVHSKKYCCYYPCLFYAPKIRRTRARENTVCAICGGKFTPKRNDAKYCSNACRQKAYRQNVTAARSDHSDHFE